MRLQFGNQIVKRLHIIGVAIPVDQKQRLHVRLLHHILEFGWPIAGVDRDENRADARRGIKNRQPVRDIGRPDADMVSLADSQGEHSLCQPVHPGVQFAVGIFQISIGINQRIVVRIFSRSLFEQFTDRTMKKIRHFILQTN